VKSFKLAFLFVALLQIHCAQSRVDLLIRNGTVVDGSGKSGQVQNVAIKDGRIFSVGSEDLPAIRVIDAGGLVVAPGFIDVHSHADRELLNQPDNHNNIRQGITTVVTGNCGHSPVDIDDFFKRLEAIGSTTNVAALVGHNSIRLAVMGSRAAEASEDELRQMEERIRSAMTAGALGLSTGLLYPPGTFASSEEVIALARVVKEFGGIYASHIRNEEHQVWQAVDEVLRIGEETGIRAQISHVKLAADAHWGKAVEYRSVLEEARNRGVLVRADQYPYTAGSATLENILPRWALDGGREAFLVRAKDPETRARMRQGIIEGRLASARGLNRAEIVYIARCRAHPECEGKNLAQLCEERGLSSSPENAAEVAISLLEDGSVSAVNFLMSEPDVRTFLQDPEIMISTDGSVTTLGEGVPHPRNYGTYPRLLGHYVREEKVLTLEEAVRKSTSLPASQMQLTDRGTLAVGNWADIVIFDPATIIDRATFEDPHQYPEGIHYVIVNGEVTVENDQITEARAGQILKRGS